MYSITKSRLCPCTDACEPVQDLTQSLFDMKRRQIYLTTAAKGMRRFSECAAPVMSPSIYMIRSCRSIPWLKIMSHPPPLPPGLTPKLFPSDFQRPSHLCAGCSTHTGVKVSYSPISTFFWIPLNSARAPASTSSTAVVLQECKNTCKRLWT